MHPRVAAEELLTGLPDEGRPLLAEMGLPTWADALMVVPDAALVGVQDADTALARLRDHLADRVPRAAFAITRALLVRRQGALGAEHPDTLVELGVLGELASRGGDRPRAGEWLDRAFQGLRAAVGGRDLRLAIVAGHRGAHLVRSKRHAEAEEMFALAYRVREAVAPASLGRVAAQLGEVRLLQDKGADAVGPLEVAYSHYRELYGPADKRTAVRGKVLARLCVVLGEADRAAPVLRDLHAAAVAGDDGELAAWAAFELGMALFRGSRAEEGQRLVEEALRRTRELGDPHPELPARLEAWSELMLARGRPDECDGLLLEALEADRRLHGEVSAEVARRYVQLARFYRALGRHTDALGWLDPGASLMRSVHGDADRRTRSAVDLLLEVLLEEAAAARGRRDKGLALDLVARALAIGEPVLGPTHATVARARRLRT